MRTLTSLVVALALALPAVGQAQCPLAPGAYTLTQHGDGFFVAGALGDVRFPPVTVIPLELGPPDAACVHPVVIPVDGTAVSDPVCLQGLGLTLQVSRSGCGVGLFDSDGGNDFTLEQVGDTSDASPACNRPHAFCQAGADDFVRSDVSMGNGSPDDCGQSRHGQLVLTVQAQFLIWHDSGGCPAPDGAFNVSQGDTLVAQLSSVVNLTTGSAHGKFADLDGDACFLAVGEGSLAELEQSGSCMDPSSRLLQLAAARTHQHERQHCARRFHRRHQRPVPSQRGAACERCDLPQPATVSDPRRVGDPVRRAARRQFRQMRDRENDPDAAVHGCGADHRRHLLAR